MGWENRRQDLKLAAGLELEMVERGEGGRGGRGRGRGRGGGEKPLDPIPGNFKIISLFFSSARIKFFFLRFNKRLSNFWLSWWG